MLPHISLWQVETVLGKVMSWTEQMLLWAFNGPDQGHSFAAYTAIGEKTNAIAAKKSFSSFYSCELWYHLNVFHDQNLTSWNLALWSTNTQLCPRSEECCLSAMTILWYHTLFSSSSIVKAEPNDRVCSSGCVIITNNSWHFKDRKSVV